MKILITGSSGLIGSSLVRSLKISGNIILSLSRKPGTDSFKWDPATGEIDIPHNINIDAVIHLAGENIARARWSKKQKGRILVRLRHGFRRIQGYRINTETEDKAK